FPEHESITSNPESEKWMGRKKSGEIFATEVFVSEVYMEGEDMLFISVLDITERHRLEQLRQDLIAMVSHDLRAPLTAIRVVLDMVGQGIYGELKGRGAIQIENAQQSTEYLISLVRDLLDSHKLESGTLEIEKADTSVGKIMKKTLTTVEGSKSNQTVKIEVDYTNDALKADEDRIVQVLINLISNAIKYSPDNSTVWVTAGMEGLNIKFQIKDEGPGIPKEMHSAVFERYRQLEQSSETKKKGFGLGLAICKALIEKHQGKIWVESEPGKGSSFCFQIPTE
ncbi:MAG TPA: HAMP domain-containing sensor histidine kinase, partial [Candidatus Melainabacteria bacterium]|nr:HAMP domain-containing sensor histidine kinase [Candidatus Melainabacteria bacterium]